MIASLKLPNERLGVATVISLVRSPNGDLRVEKIGFVK